MKLFSFKPYYGQTQSLSATGVITGIAADAEDLLLTRAGTEMMFVRVTSGTDATLATAADCPVAPGTVMIIGKSGEVQYDMTRVSVFAPLGGTIHITPGHGG